jgi:XRE family aerobic/anaerobic benzoate catabolism transcriptional regulator
MAASKAKSTLHHRAAATAAPAAARARADIDAFVAEIGALVRRGRAKHGMTRRQLAAESGASERYLAQIESGQGNPSVIILKSIAAALDVPIIALLPRSPGRTPALDRIIDRIVDRLGRMPTAELPGIAELIETRAAGDPATERAGRIALTGLRGAGKSTLGRRLARHLGCPFIELDRVVEQDYGASVPDLIEMAGQATFRRCERSCLERVIGAHERAVIATAGGIVSNPETYALLLRRTHTVWIKARPQEHMTRVMAQGDFRPMAENPEAMADLVAILEARRADYLLAQAEVDTSGKTVEQSFAKLVRVAQTCLESGAPSRAAKAPSAAKAPTSGAKRRP